MTDMAYGLGRTNTGVWYRLAFGLQKRLPFHISWALLIQLALVVGVSVVLGGYVLYAQTLSTKWLALTLMATVAPFAIMVFGEVRRLLLIVILIDIPFPLDTFIGYREAAIGGAISGYVISLSTIALAGLYVLWIGELLVNPNKAKKKSRVKNPISIWVTLLPLSFYLLVSIVSISVAVD
ncbi:MAG: hypothetical protein AAF629_33430, partial [Chloroflexota bacterium]